MSPTFCVMPWLQVAVRPDGSVRPCSWCTDTYRDENQQKYRIYEHKLDDILDSESAKKFKENILAGRWNPACIRCKEAEEVGVKSRRQQTLEDNQYKSLAKNILEGRDDIPPPEYIDLRPSNQCNVGCITCDHVSSSWIGRQLEVYPQLTKFHRWQHKPGVTKTKTSDVYRENLYQLVSQAKILYLTGGEPTLIKENWRLLEELIEKQKTQLEVRLSLNLTYITDQQIEILNQFEKVSLYFSIDSIGAEVEYIRYPSQWESMQTNLMRTLSKLRVNTNDRLLITPAVSIFNIFSLGKLLEWLEGLTHKSLGIHFYALLHDPKEFSIKNLPDHLKAEAKSQIRALMKSYPQYADTLERPLNYLNKKGDTQIFYQAKEVIDLIDSTRKRKCKIAFPRLYSELEKGCIENSRDLNG